MRLALLTIITDRFSEIRQFYEWLLDRKATIYRGSYAELELPDANLGIWTREEAAEYGLDTNPKSQPDRHRSDLVIEFEVKQVGPIYRRAKESEEAELIADLETQPWGHRGFYLRDPAGHVVNVFEQVDTEETE